jgi:hypothetical protein
MSLVAILEGLILTSKLTLSVKSENQIRLNLINIRNFDSLKIQGCQRIEQRTHYIQTTMIQKRHFNYFCL